MRCFLEKLTQQEKFLHDRRSWRSRQISSLFLSHISNNNSTYLTRDHTEDRRNYNPLEIEREQKVIVGLLLEVKWKWLDVIIWRLLLLYAIWYWYNWFNTLVSKYNTNDQIILSSFVGWKKSDTLLRMSIGDKAIKGDWYCVGKEHLIRCKELIKHLVRC